MKKTILILASIFINNICLAQVDTLAYGKNGCCVVMTDNFVLLERYHYGKPGHFNFVDTLQRVNDFLFQGQRTDNKIVIHTDGTKTLYLDDKDKLVIEVTLRKPKQREIKIWANWKRLDY